MIIYILGKMLGVEGVVLLIPALVSLIYWEKSGFSFLIVSAILCGIYLIFGRKRPKCTRIYGKESFAIVALAWLLWSLFGALPFVISGSIPNYIDAFFETVSGFTTTGSTILQEIESLPMGINFWRCLTHWIGGMGVLVFLLSLLPLAGGYHMNLMRAESPGPSVSKLVPKVQSTAKILYTIYFGMTVMQIIFLLIGRMPLFDALCITFGSAGTGGFGIKNDSMGSYSTYCQIITTIFMIAFGVNFSAYYLILKKKFRQAFAIEEVRCYLGIIAAAIVIIAINTRHLFSGIGTAVQQAAFQVGSIITTTGYSSTDFNQWPSLSKAVLVLLMFIGACAGSTGGGIKVSRILLLCKAAGKELQHYLHPSSVKKLKMDDKPVSHEMLRSTNIFLSVYLINFAASILIVAIDNFDLVSTFTAVATTLNNIGPGLEVAGPLGNFSSFSYLSKSVMIFDMLAGRLEIFPLLLLFCRGTWKKF